jgi:hypothetical protein
MASRCISLPLLAITRVSIRRLDLREYHYNDKWHCCDEEECIQLSNLPLGKQCETLLITVKSRGCILNLVNHMPKLQALTVLDDTLVNKKISKNDELIEWLRQQFSSTCSIARNTNFHRDILL